MTLALIIVSTALVVMTLAFYGALGDVDTLQAERDAACDSVDDLEEHSRRLRGLLVADAIEKRHLDRALSHALNGDLDAAWALIGETTGGDV